MKKVIIGIVGILLLGGGAAGGYLFLKKPAEASLTEEDVAKEKKHAKKGSHGEAVEFVQLDPLILPIVDRNGLSQVVSIVVALEVPSKADADKVKMLQPKLKDAFISEMYGVIHHPAGLQEGNLVKVQILKDRLGKIGRKVLGDEVVNDVLLQVVQQRPA